MTLTALDRRGDFQTSGATTRTPGILARSRAQVGRQVAEDRGRDVLAEDHHPLDLAEGVADQVPQAPREAEQAEDAEDRDRQADQGQGRPQGAGQQVPPGEGPHASESASAPSGCRSRRRSIRPRRPRGWPAEALARIIVSRSDRAKGERRQAAVRASDRRGRTCPSQDPARPECVGSLRAAESASGFARLAAGLGGRRLGCGRRSLGPAASTRAASLGRGVLAGLSSRACQSCLSWPKVRSGTLPVRASFDSGGGGGGRLGGPAGGRGGGVRSKRPGPARPPRPGPPPYWWRGPPRPGPRESRRGPPGPAAAGPLASAARGAIGPPRRGVSHRDARAGGLRGAWPSRRGGRPACPSGRRSPPPRGSPRPRPAAPAAVVAPGTLGAGLDHRQRDPLPLLSTPMTQTVTTSPTLTTSCGLLM